MLQGIVLLFFSFLQSSFKRLFWTWVMLAGRLCWPTLCFQLRLNKSSIGRNWAYREIHKHCSFGMKVKFVKFPIRIMLKSIFTFWRTSKKIFCQMPLQSTQTNVFWIRTHNFILKSIWKWKNYCKTQKKNGIALQILFPLHLPQRRFLGKQMALLIILLSSHIHSYNLLIVF